jgi:peptidoglycan/LPS O-acetylase OafA/YrhL
MSDAGPSDRPAGVRASRAYFPELESLRGVAIALVFAFHADGILHSGTQAPAPILTGVQLPLAFVYAGHTGVSLFFLLSGFLLSLPFLDPARPPVSIGNYLRRRAWRILPLYWTLLAIAAAVSCVLTHALAPLLAAAGYAVFLNSVVDMRLALFPFNIPLWSLATEAQFYLVLPVLVLLRRARWLGTVLVLGWAVVFGAYTAGYLHVGSTAGQLALRKSVVGRSPAFVAGILAAALYVRRGTRLRERLRSQAALARGGADVGVVAILIGLAALLRWAVQAGTNADAHPVWRVAEAAGWGGILLLILLAPLRSRPAFVNPVFDLLGRLSYSIYLTHVPVLVIGIVLLRSRFPGDLTAWTPFGSAVVVALSAAAMACAAATYTLIERPFLVRKARIER